MKWSHRPFQRNPALPALHRTDLGRRRETAREDLAISPLLLTDSFSLLEDTRPDNTGGHRNRRDHQPAHCAGLRRTDPQPALAERLVVCVPGPEIATPIRVFRAVASPRIRHAGDTLSLVLPCRPV